MGVGGFLFGLWGGCYLVCVLFGVWWLVVCVFVMVVVFVWLGGVWGVYGWVCGLYVIGVGVLLVGGFGLCVGLLVWVGVDGFGVLGGGGVFFVDFIFIVWFVFWVGWLVLGVCCGYFLVWVGCFFVYFVFYGWGIYGGGVIFWLLVLDVFVCFSIWWLGWYWMVIVG